MKRLPAPTSFTLLPETPSLTIEEIKEIAASFKEDLQRKKDGYIRKDENKDAYAALLGQEYVDKFVSTLELRAGSQLDTLKRPARARSIHIPEFIAKKKGKE